MPSTYTNSLRFVLPATGELSNTWGTVFNAGATSLIDAAIAGTASITMTAADYTLSNNNGAADEARAMFIVLGGTPGASYNVICPAVSKLYFVTNNTGFAQTFKTLAGTGISIPNGARVALRCDGTNVVEALSSGVTSISFGSTGLTPSTATTGAVTVAGTLAVSNGGTGLTTGTSGGVPFFSAANTIASSAALAANALVVGGGAGVAPSTITTGTGVVTALGVNTGTAGAFVVNGGALGTPASGTVTNLTGTASININGTVGATTPNTGAFTSITSTSASGVLTRAAATQDGVEMVGRAGGSTSLKVTLTPTTLSASRTLTLPDNSGTVLTTGATVTVAQGGTGATTLTANNVILGNGTSAVQFVAPGTNGNVLTSNGTTWVSQAAAASLLGQTDSATPFETALGYQAGNVNTGTNNTFVGYQAGLGNTTGANNTAVGYSTLDACTTGQQNAGLGSDALGANTTGAFNVALGHQALLGITTGNANVGIGRGVISFSDCSANVAVGDQALRSNSANNNTAVGYSAMFANTTGTNNTAVGYEALDANTTGSNNTAVGYQAGDKITTGTQNVVIGDSAGSSGTNDLTTGSNNTIIGYNAASSTATVSNEITLGNASIATIRAQVTTITALSDARDKKDIAPLSAGLAFTNALKPVAFIWNMRDGGKVGIPDTGFIAQDLKAVQEQTGVLIPGLVYESNPDRLEAGYGKLLPVLVKAIQELSAKVEILEAKLKGN